MKMIKFNKILNCILLITKKERLCNSFPCSMLDNKDPQRPATTSRLGAQSEPQTRQQFKLPKISVPQSRGRLMSRKQNKAPTYLPHIHDEQQADKNFRNTQMIHVSKSENDIVKGKQNFSRDQFAYEIQEKIDNIINYQPVKTNQHYQHEPNEQQSDHLSDDLDFQQKILQNKQIIKKHRKKTQLTDKRTSKPLQTLQKINEFNRLKSNKPQSNYEKKMKQYNMSLQNKYLQRKKQSLGIILQKPQKPVQRAKSKKILSLKDAAIDQAKLNFGYKQFKNVTNPTQPLIKSQQKDTSRPFNMMQVNKSHKQPSIIPQKHSPKQTHKTQEPVSPSKRINRTSALFDNIQSFLENPMASQKHEKLYKELYKKLKAKSIPQLQDQIKELNEKMGVDQNYETKSTVGKEESLRQILLTESPMERTVRDWKRVEVKDKHNIRCEESNFEKELDYISFLQEKNSASLSKFIDQQKLMVELQIHRRLAKSIGKDINTNLQGDKQSKQQNNEIRQSNTAEEST